jgi:hypothetical protein
VRTSRIAALVPLCLLLLLLVSKASSVRADHREVRRAYKPLRDDENWAWLRETSASDYWDPIKYLRVTPRRSDLYLTIGGEVRLWGEFFQHEQWGSTGHARDGAFLQRYMLHADAHLTRHLRVFVQLKSGLAAFQEDGPGPVDQDLLDFNQLYLDLIAIPGATLDDEPRLLLRGGRQELSFGSGRLVEVREGPNVRFGYDGIRLIARPGRARIDAFALRPNVTAPGAFDDRWDSSQWFWGLYSTYNLPFLTVDAYYLGRQRDRATYERGQASELRHTVGGRARATLRSIELELEAAYQFGSFGALPISAWTVAGELQLRSENLPLHPRLILGGGITSGDGGAASPSLGTFSALFPRGAYFGLLAPNGPANNFAPHAGLQLSLPASLTLLTELWAFFRESVHDGVYSVPGTLFRAGHGHPSRYLGTQTETWLTWQASRHLLLSTTFGYFWAGSFLRDNPPDEDTTYVAAWMTYKF